MPLHILCNVANRETNLEQPTTAPFKQIDTANIDAVPFPVILLDRRNHITYVNKTGSQFLSKFQEEGAIGADFVDVFERISRTSKLNHQKLQDHLDSNEIGQLQLHWNFKQHGKATVFVDRISSGKEITTQLFIQLGIPDATQLEATFTELFLKDRDPVLIINKTRDRILELNDAFIKQIGYTRGELMNKPISKIEKEVSDQLIHSIGDEIQKKGTSDFQQTLIHKDGSHIHRNVSAKIVRFQDDECYHYHYSEIEENKASENHIFSRTNLLNNVIQQSTEAVLVADNDLNILIWNEKATELLGIGSSKDNKPSWSEEYELYNIDTVTRISEEHLPLTRAIKQGITSRNSEIYIKDTDMYLSVNATPLYDEEFIQIGGMAVISDITAMKKAEISVKKSEQKFRNLFENNNDGIYIVNRKSSIVKQVNNKAAEILGYTTDELIGNSIEIVNTAFDRMQKDWIEEELEKHGKVTFEHKYRKKSGDLLPVEVSAKIGEYEGNEVIQYQARDISARIKAEEDFQRSYKEILFTQSLLKAGDQGKSFAQLNKKILDGIAELIQPSASRLYSYDSRENKLTIEAEYLNSKNRDTLENLAKVKIKTVVPDVKTNSFYLQLLENKEPLIIDSQENKEKFIAEHTSKKSLKKLAPKIIKILNIEVFVLLPIMFGPEVGSIISFTLNEKPSKEKLDIIFRYLQQANNVLNKIRFESDLKISNDKYTDLVDNLKDAVISLNKDGVISLANNAAQKLFGYSQKELLKIKLTDLMHPEDKENVENFYSKVTPHDPNANYISRVIDKKGETKYIEVSSTAVFNEDEEYLGSRDIVRNITSKKLQDRNKQVQQGLLENVAKGVEYNLVVHQALLALEEVRSGDVLAAVYSYNRIEKRFSLLGCNSGNEEAFFENLEFEGLYPKDLIKENTKGDYARFTLGENQTSEKYSKIGYAFPTVSRHLGIRGIILLIFNTEKEITIKEVDSVNTINNILKISIEHHQSKDEIKQFTENLEGAVERRTEELRNEIFERRIIEKELERSKDLAESASNAKTNFLANMSHEIRSPLNAILGFSQIMKGISEKEGFSAKSISYMENIEMSSKNLSAIINDILDLSKIESGKLELDNEDFELEQIIKNVYHLNKSAAKEKGLKFNYTIDDSLPKFIYGDRTKLMQVLMNLTANAIKFTERDKVVKIHAQKQSQNLVFLVEDEGIGIDSTRLESIFEPFEQEDTSVTREFGGSGLGLAISKSIVKLMEGIITVKSTKEKGSVFKVTLPLVVGKTVEKLRQQKFQNYNDIQFDENFKVLLVEDNVLNQDLVGALMEQINVELIIANNGLEGIEFAEKHMPSTILMDMHMPGMDGIETIKRIKDNDKTAHIPIIGYSADAFAETRKKAYETGVLDYLTKPLDLNKLLSVLNRFGRSPNIELDFGSGTDDQDQISPNSHINIPEEHKEHILNHIKDMQSIAIFESEKLLEKLNDLMAYSDQHNIDLLNKEKAISDAIYDGDENQLNSELNSLL